jgi:uncharacterized protein YnzC (UPF0291/DUF896 family)
VEGEAPEIEMDDNRPKAIPIHELGVVDIEGEDVSCGKLVENAFRNAGESFDDTATNEEGYVFRRGSECVNEYARRDEEGLITEGEDNNPNHLLGAFPYLFPYGEGGFETKRPRAISYVDHARWALEYEDRQFLRHMSFIFQVFGVIQKRQVCRAAEVQVSDIS